MDFRHKAVCPPPPPPRRDSWGLHEPVGYSEAPSYFVSAAPPPLPRGGDFGLPDFSHSSYGLGDFLHSRVHEAEMRPPTRYSQQDATHEAAFAPPERPQKPRMGGIVAELTGDGRFYSEAPCTGANYHPPHDEGRNHFGVAGAVNPDDDDWAKNPDIRSYWAGPDAKLGSFIRPVASATPSRYAGIAAELTSDGRLDPEPYPGGYQPSGGPAGKGYSKPRTPGNDWRREWRGEEPSRLQHAEERQRNQRAPADSKGKGKGKKGKDGVRPEWYGWSKGDLEDREMRRPPDVDRRTKQAEARPRAEKGSSNRKGRQEDRQEGRAARERRPSHDNKKKETEDGGRKARDKKQRKKSQKDDTEPDAGLTPEKEESAKQCRAALSAERAAEASREEVPLELLWERAKPSEPWEEVVADAHLRSWMYIRRRHPLVRQEDFDTLRENAPWQDLIGKSGMATRRTAWMVRNGCSCSYRYGHTIQEPVEMPSWMFDLMVRWLQDFNLTTADLPNAVNLNLYADGNHSVGWHSDEEHPFRTEAGDCRIISISLGHPRKFRVGMRSDGRRMKLEPAGGAVSDVLLSHGDICTMEGRFQKHFVHQVARDRGVTKPRVNATFRWITRHSRNCSLHEPRDSEPGETTSEESEPET